MKIHILNQKNLSPAQVDANSRFTRFYYCGRSQAPHPKIVKAHLGNPFQLGQDGTRAQICAYYLLGLGGHVTDMPEHLQAIGMQIHQTHRARIEEIAKQCVQNEDVSEIALVCWCYPLMCHCHMIRFYLEDQVAKFRALAS